MSKSKVYCVNNAHIVNNSYKTQCIFMPSYKSNFFFQRKKNIHDNNKTILKHQNLAIESSIVYVYLKR